MWAERVDARAKSMMAMARYLFLSRNLDKMAKILIVKPRPILKRLKRSPKVSSLKG